MTITRYQGNAYTLDRQTGALLAAPINADDSIDWDNITEVDVDHLDAEEYLATVLAEVDVDHLDAEEYLTHDRALGVVWAAHWTWRHFGDPVNRANAQSAAFIASGRLAHSAEDARTGGCFCDWCASL